MIFGGKVIRVEVLNEDGTLIVKAEKHFVVPPNINSDEESIVMIKGKGLPELQNNRVVHLILTTKANDRIKLTGMISMSMDKQMNIRITRANDTQVLKERRRFYKLKVDVSGRALFYIRDEKTERYDEPRPIKVHDINLGGVFFSVDDEYMNDDMVCIEVDLLEDYPLNAAVRILRVQRDADGTIIGYGCEFQGLTAAQEDYIGKFVYKVQSEERMKKAAQEDSL